MVRKVQPVKNWSEYPANNHVPEGSQDLDIKEIYRILGFRDGSHLEKSKDPISEILDALNTYTQDAYPVHMPSFQSRFAAIKEIRDKTSALLDIIGDIGEETYDDIQTAIARGLGQVDHHNWPKDEPPSREMWVFGAFTSTHLYDFKKLMDLAVTEFPNDPDAPPKGRPPKTALKELIRELAWIFERVTGHDAYAGFSSAQDDPKSNKQDYDSTFFQFVWEIVSKFDPGEAKTNNALGSQIRSALNNRNEPPEMTFTFEDDDEATTLEEYMNPNKST